MSDERQPMGIAMSELSALNLEAHFDAAFSAPSGTARLREMILTLAMQGKLVAQDASDEPASVLLEKITAEKTALVKAGKIRAPKPLPPIADSEKPHALPSGWEWARLADFADYNGRDNIEPSKIAKSTWLLDLEDIEKGTSRILYRAKYAERESKSTKSMFKAGDVLYGKLRPYLDKVVVADGDGVCTTEIVPVVPSKAIAPEYLRWLLKRPGFLAHVNSLMYGVKMPRLGTDDAINSVHPLPPLAEQKRIVAKLDQMMAQCDELEKIRARQQEKRCATQAAALRQWLSADDAQVRARAQRFIAGHFEELHVSRESVAELRKAILQLAVMGRLVAQNASDEPASVLLGMIAAEKAALVKAGKIRAPKPLPPIAESEKPYALPSGWEWVRLQDLLAIVTDGDHQPPPKAIKGIPFLVIGNLNTGAVVLDGCRFVPDSYYEALDWARKPTSGDVLYTVTGSFGITIPIVTSEKFCVQRHVAIFKTTSSTPTSYLIHFLRSAEALTYAEEIATGIAQKTVPLTGLRDMPIALPPLAEQTRIVAKLKDLMALCDALESRIDAAERKQSQLLEAVAAAA
ncbi:restriction endonuclease subunit S [Paraburkholderia sp. CNPSo 3281]|uniref:restriction endonuclease subunit S n=1 Tax=Paraburkholderia sp. CNPSo 3281 TaxID=2940933 RepID=UPI0020B7AF3F|nr:restriction endonuclease subunit S [Paraburkholderia sp. CNPSo 3281]MCP3713865.1 restriction endonuclease subunit S [Paraburkholderia sp. CNPSo 3281]